MHLPKYWLVHDEPEADIYSRSRENSPHKKMLFHVSAGDYISTLASILRFFQETIYEQKTTLEMRRLQKKIIVDLIDDLLYLDKGFTIVPKDKNEQLS